MSSLIESIERATIAAVRPEALEELPGWLLPLDRGSVGRAHSAVPLAHEAPPLAALAQIEARYAAHGLPPVFRLPAAQPAWAGFGAALRERGYVSAHATVVKRGSARRMVEGGGASAAEGAADPDVDAGVDPGVRIDGQPQPDWARVYLGEGFDAAEGADRVRLLRRAQDALYLSLRVPEGESGAGSVAAVGCVCFAEGWAGVHGMRTRPMFRGRGYARRVLAAAGREALARGIERAFLQVEIENQRARGLYARTGFEPLWTYVYWRQPRGLAVDRP